MSHLEARQEKDLNGIRERMITQADAVAVAVENAVRSVQTNDRRLAYDTVLADHPINRLTREIDKLCHRFIAVHLPSAGPLRLTVARETAQMSAPPEGIMARELDRVAGETLLMLRQSVKAFKELNAELARGTVGIADQLQLHMDMVYAELRANTDKDKIKDSLAIFVVFTQLKRVADQAKNLCEHTIFAQTGEQKAPKVYRILFVDRDNSRLGPMAQAIAAHAFTNSGRYRTAGLAPAVALDGQLTQFLEGRGIDTAALKPGALADITLAELSEQQVLVCLECSMQDLTRDLPFHTSMLEWQLEPAADMETLYRDLAGRISDLMELLRGPGAD